MFMYEKGDVTSPAAEERERPTFCPDPDVLRCHISWHSKSDGIESELAYYFSVYRLGLLPRPHQVTGLPRYK